MPAKTNPKHSPFHRYRACPHKLDLGKYFSKKNAVREHGKAFSKKNAVREHGKAFFRK